MAYDGTKLHFGEQISEAEALECLSALVNRYVKNIGTTGEFVTCITPDGPMIEWERAKVILRRAGRLG